MRWLKGWIGGAATSPALRHTAALVTYVGVFSGLLLPKLLPAQPGRFLSNSPADGSIFLWSLGWWPHAVSHGIFLPYTHAVFAPGGMNLAWTTSIPVPGLLLGPVTRAFGIFATFNVLALLAPMTAAWATYLLVNRATRRWWPSLVAGLLFALSPLEMTEVAIGHLNLTLVALIPLAAYLVVRQVEGSLQPVAFVPLLGLVLAAEFGISTEVLATTTLFGAMALLLVYVFDRVRRPAFRRCAMLAGFSYIVAGVLASPMLYAAFALPHPTGVTSIGGSPTPASGVRTSFNSGSSTLRAGLLHPLRWGARSALALLVLSLTAILLHLMWRRRSEPAVRALAATAVVALVCSAGVLVVGSTVVPTPWALARHLPFFGLVRPQRLTMFFWLIASVGVGVWLAERPRSRRRWGAAALVLAATLPVVWSGSWTSVIQTPSFLAAGHSSLATGENILVVAGPGGPGSHQLDDLAYPTVWQVESDFSFRLANAYVGSFPPALPVAVRRLIFDRPLLPGQGLEVLAWLRRAGVGVVQVMHPTPGVVRALQHLLGTPPQRLGEVVFFEVAASTPTAASTASAMEEGYRD